ncbi:hypothetical protein [Pararhizobium qamdonense]|uniref:hypothetical protein n=1 Tax=Pararhizobium qamdonense TaxID=3031126 RepID=UPI0023E144C7|nr:hypothetical protein [Pararhizobium qamdonense]
MATLSGQPAATTGLFEGMAAQAALASLMDRVGAARVLREHHVWEAVRILPETAGLPEDIKQSPELRRLMEKEAFTAALRLLAHACTPARDLSDLEPHGDCWTATVSAYGGLDRARRCRFTQAGHRDPPAAVLIALLGSAIRTSSRFVRQKWSKAAVQQELGK